MSRLSLLLSVALVCGCADAYVQPRAGNSQVHKFGNNADIDNAETEDIWDGGNNANADGAYTYPSTAEELHISSSEGADTQQITVRGLDADWNDQEVTVTLAGQTETVIGTSITWIRAFRAFNANSTALTGTVYIYADDTVVAGVPQTNNKVRAIITIGEDQTLMALYSVPLGKEFVVTAWYAALTGTAVAAPIVRLKTREFGKSFRTTELRTLNSTGNSSADRAYALPIRFPAKSDIKMDTTANAANTKVAAGFDGFLIAAGSR